MDRPTFFVVKMNAKTEKNITKFSNSRRQEYSDLSLLAYTEIRNKYSCADKTSSGGKELKIWGARSHNWRTLVGWWGCFFLLLKCRVGTAVSRLFRTRLLTPMTEVPPSRVFPSQHLLYVGPWILNHVNYKGLFIPKNNLRQGRPFKRGALVLNP